MKILSKLVSPLKPLTTPSLMFFEKVVPSALHIMRVRSFSHNLIRVDEKEIDEKETFSETKQTIWSGTTDCIFNVLLNEESIALLRKIKKTSTSLDRVAGVYYGIKTGNNKKYLANEEINENYKPALKTKEITRYSIEWQKLYLHYGEHLAGFTNRDLEIPKISNCLAK